MKARFTIERTFANVIELELDDATVAIESKNGFDNIMHLAEAQYSDLVDAGKEPEIGDQLDVTLIPVCDRCGQEICGEEETPCLVDGHMVCESCYDLVSKHRQREYELHDAGVDLEKIASLIDEKMREYNKRSVYSGIISAEINGIRILLSSMNIPCTIHYNERFYSSFTLNGKTYTI